MTSHINDTYLEARVRTATPQRRQLMLIEGALRFARLAVEQWDGGLPNEEVYSNIVRCRDIVAEIYGGIRQDQAPVAKQVAAIYLFLFRLLAEAPLHEDPQRVRDVIRVLEEEQKTWQLVCEQMPEPPAGTALQTGTSDEITARDVLPPGNVPNERNGALVDLDIADDSASGQLSLEA